MVDEDRGQGNVTKFPAEDLERLYRLGEPEGTVRIRGGLLNEALGVTTYKANAWYRVTAEGIEKF